jgi:hypothetical protein
MGAEPGRPTPSVDEAKLERLLTERDPYKASF